MGVVRRILVVDDEPTVGEVIRSCLEDWSGSEVDYVLKGREGAEKIRKGPYDLALIDGLLPEISGLQLAEMAVNSNVPVLLVCGHPELIVKLEAADFPHLAKPFTLDDLLLYSKRAVAESMENIRRVRTSLETIKLREEVVKATLQEARRLIQDAAAKQTDFKQRGTRHLGGGWSE